MLDEMISFDDTNDKVIWGSVFTGIGFTLGMSCFLLQCLRRKCQRRKCQRRKRRRPVVKILKESQKSDDDTTSSAIELTPEPTSDATTDYESDEEGEMNEVAVSKGANAPPTILERIVPISNILNTSTPQATRPKGIVYL
jgi:hypothetical protein